MMEVKQVATAWKQTSFEIACCLRTTHSYKHGGHLQVFQGNPNNLSIWKSSYYDSQSKMQQTHKKLQHTFRDTQVPALEYKWSLSVGRSILPLSIISCFLHLLTPTLVLCQRQGSWRAGFDLQPLLLLAGHPTPAAGIKSQAAACSGPSCLINLQ